MPSTINTATREMRSMINDAEQLLKEASMATGDKAAELQKKGMALLACSISKAHELERNALHSVKELATSADDMVHANPWRTAAVSGLLGAGIGLVLGLAMARK
jgi:ElaB/YqjD/DUF883 family membrane-anchored ribosome-binding protein